MQLIKQGFKNSDENTNRGGKSYRIENNTSSRDYSFSWVALAKETTTIVARPWPLETTLCFLGDRNVSLPKHSSDSDRRKRNVPQNSHHWILTTCIS